MRNYVKRIRPSINELISKHAGLFHERVKNNRGNTFEWFSSSDASESFVGPLVSSRYVGFASLLVTTHTEGASLVRRKSKTNERATFSNDLAWEGPRAATHSNTLEMYLSQLARLTAIATAGTDGASFLLARRRKTL